jgi:radical SAM superfamily enzyme YgiQ (UPF0313 family)
MHEKMKEYGIPVTAHESGDPLTAFDFVAFTLQYELCYTTALQMLKLSGIPLYSRDRDETMPIVIGGGPCVYNAEPIADFFDVFSIGEGEEALVEINNLYIKMKESGSYSKKECLHEAAKLEGFYVPSLYDVSYNEDGTIKAYTPVYDDIPAKITRKALSPMSFSPASRRLAIPLWKTANMKIRINITTCRVNRKTVNHELKTNAVLNEHSIAAIIDSKRVELILTCLVSLEYN